MDLSKITYIIDKEGNVIDLRNYSISLNMQKPMDMNLANNQMPMGFEQNNVNNGDNPPLFNKKDNEEMQKPFDRNDNIANDPPNGPQNPNIGMNENFDFDRNDNMAFVAETTNSSTSILVYLLVSFAFLAIGLAIVRKKKY